MVHAPAGPLASSPCQPGRATPITATTAGGVGQAILATVFGSRRQSPHDLPESFAGPPDPRIPPRVPRSKTPEDIDF